MNANTPSQQNWRKVEPETADDSPTSPGASAHFEKALGLRFVPSGNNPDGSNSPSISAIKFLVTVLTPDVDPANVATEDWREVFLRTLARAPVVAVAAKIAGVSRAQALKERKANSEFARRWNEAMEDGLDEIEAAAFRSAVYGNEKPIFYHGYPVGQTTTCSHAAQAMLLKARRPSVFNKENEPEKPRPVMMTLAELKARVDEVRRNSSPVDPV